MFEIIAILLTLNTYWFLKTDNVELGLFGWFYGSAISITLTYGAYEIFKMLA